MSGRNAPAAVRWTAYVAVAVVFAVACAFLSQWQFARNAGRAEQLTLVEANYDAPPVPLADVLAAGSALDAEDPWRPVELRGSYLAEEQILVRNRAHGGSAAFEVLVPFLLDDGRMLLVDRGWVPPGETRREPDAVPAPPPGEVTVIARLRPGEPLASSGGAVTDGQIATIHLPAVADAIPGGAALETTAYGLMESEDPAPAERPGVLASPSEDPGPHLSYAVQWILFAAMGFVFIFYVIRTERRARREDADDVPARPRDRDTAEEDAILDGVDGH